MLGYGLPENNVNFTLMKKKSTKYVLCLELAYLSSQPMKQ